VHRVGDGNHHVTASKACICVFVRLLPGHLAKSVSLQSPTDRLVCVGPAQLKLLEPTDTDVEAIEEAIKGG
jgi:hypothetical protein